MAQESKPRGDRGDDDNTLRIAGGLELQLVSDQVAKQCNRLASEEADLKRQLEELASAKAAATRQVNELHRANREPEQGARRSQRVALSCNARLPHWPVEP